MPTLPPYAELHCRSNFSFLTGASHPEELVLRAAHLGYSALAITDECSLSGVVRAHTEAKRSGLHLIIGSEMQLTLPSKAAAAPADAVPEERPQADDIRRPPPEGDGETSGGRAFPHAGKKNPLG